MAVSMYTYVNESRDLLRVNIYERECRMQLCALSCPQRIRQVSSA